MSIEYNIENVPNRKEKQRLLEEIKKLIPPPLQPRDGVDGKTPTEEELKKLIKSVLPEPPKGVSKKDLGDMIAKHISKLKIEPLKQQIETKEDDRGLIITIDGKEHIIPRAVYGPKLRNFSQLGDVASYSGEAGKFARVNDTETGLEFSTVSTADEKVKLSETDETAGYLISKLTEIYDNSYNAFVIG